MLKCNSNVSIQLEIGNKDLSCYMIRFYVRVRCQAFGLLIKLFSSLLLLLLLCCCCCCCVVVVVVVVVFVNMIQTVNCVLCVSEER